MNDETDTSEEEFDRMWDSADPVHTITPKSVIADLIYREMMRDAGTSTGYVPPWIDRAVEAIWQEFTCRRCGYGIVDLGVYGNACNDCRPRLGGEGKL